jgi:hypothetical protein
MGIEAGNVKPINIAFTRFILLSGEGQLPKQIAGVATPAMRCVYGDS